MSRLTNIILVVFFAGLLLAPTVASLCGFNPMGKLDERRALAAKPRSCPTWRECLSSTSSVAALAQAWDKYYTDHFGLRKLLIGTYRLALFHVLRTSPNPAVVVGRSNGGQRWLFYDGTIANDGIGFESLLGKKPYTDQELALIAGNLTRWTELAQRNGVKLLILPIPDKQSIYPENLPRRLQPTAGSRSRLDQFWTMAEKLKGVPLIDIRSALRTAKQTKQVYYATDNHWNEQGALIAYQLLMDALRLQDNGSTTEGCRSMGATKAGNIRQSPGFRPSCPLRRVAGGPHTANQPACGWVSTGQAAGAIRFLLRGHSALFRI
jgi:hypothetical protein